MDFKDVARRRRMVRNYTSEPVERAALERIVKTARRAPSAGFTQGQYFIVVTDDATRKAVAELAGESDYVDKGFPAWMSSAPAHIVVCVSEADYHARYREPDKLTADRTEIEWPIPYWWVDVGASLMLALLAAVDEGLVAGFFGFHRLAGLNDLLDIPPEVTPIGVVTVGHPAPDRPGSSTRGWKPEERIIHWERWTP